MNELWFSVLEDFFLVEPKDQVIVSVILTFFKKKKFRIFQRPTYKSSNFITAHIMFKLHVQQECEMSVCWNIVILSDVVMCCILYHL